MITVHHLNNSRSQRVLWLLEELELPYEIVHYQRDPKTMLAPPSLRAVHPLGKSPVVTTDDGLTLAESGAIVETLIERYGNGRLAPAAGHARGAALSLLAALRRRLGDAAAAAQAGVRPDRERQDALLRQADRARRSRARPRPASSRRNITSHLDFMEGELGKSEWFAGDAFTRRRHPDELSGRSRAGARRARRVAAQLDGVPGAHPRAAGLPARAGARRAVRPA